MKYKGLVGVSFFIIIFLMCIISSTQEFTPNFTYRTPINMLNTSDDENDAINNMTRAEMLIKLNYNILLSTELIDGEVLLIYLCLTPAINYLNLAQREYLNESYVDAIDYAQRSYAISLGVLPFNLIKAFETQSEQQLLTILLPIIIIIIIFTIILAIIAVHYLRKFYIKKKKEKKILKQKITLLDG